MTSAVYGIIGWPVAQSRSPAMQGAAFAAADLDAQYVPFAVHPDRLTEALVGAQALGVRGLNVTVPHKERALRLCRPDALAARVGAVNTLRFDAPDAPPVGYNTDVYGVERWLDEEGGAPGPRAVLLGAGGAARAVALALRSRGFELRVCNRSARDLVIDGTPLNVEPLDQLPSLLASCDLLIDATPRGLDRQSPPIDLSPLPPHALVLDCTVAPSTPLCDAARGRGLRAATGVAMLLHQGAAAFEHWTGRSAPLDVMRRTLLHTLG